MAIDVQHETETLERFGALADPTRMAILGLLRRQDQCVCHFVEELGLKQSVVSHHVGVLRRAGLITSYPHATDRRWLYHRLNREALAGLADNLAWLLDESDYNLTPLACGADATGDE